MGTEAPTTIVIPVPCAPKKAPCPKCGKPGRRKRTLTRTVRTVASKAVAFLEFTYGEYGARCDCCTTYCNTIDRVLPRALSDNKARDLVLKRILQDGMSIERTLLSLPREFLLDLSSGFVDDLLRDRAEQLDMAAHRRKVMDHFSGTLSVDELHLGRFILLSATDPLSDSPAAFALVAANDQDHMRRFLGTQDRPALGAHHRIVPVPAPQAIAGRADPHRPGDLGNHPLRRGRARPPQAAALRRRETALRHLRAGGARPRVHAFPAGDHRHPHGPARCRAPPKPDRAVLPAREPPGHHPLDRHRSRSPLYDDALRLHIARAYHLDYDEGTRTTRGEEGYFWREATTNGARRLKA
jgi:hypothetical protein